ncbi:MAG: DUF692 family protein [Anaerolineae bacterium]|jgi:uncharacterized protein (UPF0276 family)|nr:DUF692 family protein [Anaerolineae bacterium]
MRLAANYSPALADLVARGRAEVDLFKLPAWPDLIAKLSTDGVGPSYIHFPLLAGTGVGGPINTETNAAPDWAQIDALLEATHTPWVSAHMGPRPEDHPHLSGASPEVQTETLVRTLVADLQPLVARYGPKRVVGENIFEFYGTHLRAAMFPEVLSRAVEASGCGFLLDLSHAQLAARALGVDPRAYVEAMPVARIREIHVTGVQRFDAPWIDRARAVGVDPGLIEQIADQYIDHLPMVDDDWEFLAWAMGRIQEGAWATPEIIAYECGGVGPLFAALTLPDVLAEQVPRLYAMVHERS